MSYTTHEPISTRNSLPEWAWSSNITGCWSVFQLLKSKLLKCLIYVTATTRTWKVNLFLPSVLTFWQFARTGISFPTSRVTYIGTSQLNSLPETKRGYRKLPQRLSFSQNAKCCHRCLNLAKSKQTKGTSSWFSAIVSQFALNANQTKPSYNYGSTWSFKILYWRAK